MRDQIEQIPLESQGGFDLTLTAYYDDTNPAKDYECYTPKQVEAWRNDEWFFVALEVTAHKHGVSLASAYLGGFEYGSVPITDESDTLSGYADITLQAISRDNDLSDMTTWAIDEAKQTIEKLSK